jgi:hemolysin-activating ACP:hemolysin acyltransferase
MFFRSKDSKESARPDPSAVQADKLAPLPDKTAALPGQEATSTEISAPTVAAAAPRADKSLPPEELKTRAQEAQREAAAIGQIVTLMIASLPHKDRTLSDLRGTVLPAIRSGQYAVASGQSRSKGYSKSLAAVVWASVSVEVDKRLYDAKTPARLNSAEWKSGNILWLVETIGDDRAVQALVQRLRHNEWKGRSVKVRMTDDKGQVTIRTIEPLPPPNGATDRTR